MARVEFLGHTLPIEQEPFEVVERKGVGHPDTLADGAAEAISNAFASHTEAEYGAVLNHNVDKLYIVGGAVDVDFGRGQVLAPAQLILGGRMTTSFGGKPTNAFELAEHTAAEYVRGILPHMGDGELTTTVLTNDYSHNPYHFHPRSLADVPSATDPRANDTSTTVGYWPMSDTERLALGLEGYFYDQAGGPVSIMSARISKSWPSGLATWWMSPCVCRSWASTPHHSKITMSVTGSLKLSCQSMPH